MHGVTVEERPSIERGAAASIEMADYLPKKQNNHSTANCISCSVCACACDCNRFRRTADERGLSAGRTHACSCIGGCRLVHGLEAVRLRG